MRTRSAVRALSAHVAIRRVTEAAQPEARLRERDKVRWVTTRHFRGYLSRIKTNGVGLTTKVPMILTTASQTARLNARSACAHAPTRCAPRAPARNAEHRDQHSTLRVGARKRH